MEEIWKKIDGFENYEISNFGQVRRFKNNEYDYKTPNKNIIYLYKNGIWVKFRVNKLLLIFPENTIKVNDLENEEWKELKEHKGMYISNMGRLKNINFHNTGEEKLLNVDYNYIVYRNNITNINIHNSKKIITRIFSRKYN